MLLAAQRQEGFRQSILESIDISLPDAFRHMLKVIIDNNLVRFSSTVPRPTCGSPSGSIRRVPGISATPSKPCRGF